MDPLSDESEEILGENGPPVYSGTFWGKGKSWMCEAARWWFQASTASLTVGKLDLFVWSPLKLGEDEPNFLLMFFRMGSNVEPPSRKAESMLKASYALIFE